ncbi:MAG: hypothetical protein B0D92_05515 [Spirochaeta sp. LUC14_002_19_P3]|nr:MAG: hypothetical protein B0D92_05515 [Spirochaeta sp. LUC14_002_19_P3]
MPIYEYICRSCGQEQEYLTTLNAENPPCGNCGSNALLKKLSAFSVVSSAKAGCDANGSLCQSGEPESCGLPGGCGCF